MNKRFLHFTARLDAQLRRAKGSRGQTLVEYAMILALISVVAISVLLSLGQQTRGIYTMINSQISQAAASH